MVWALLPLKDLVRAKSRLAGVLAPYERRALAQAMAEDVLSALLAVEQIEGVLLVSDDPGAGLLGHKYPIEVVTETALGCSGLNATVRAGVSWLAQRGVEDALVVHSDLPLLRPEDLQQLLARYRDPDIDLVLVPDNPGQGTNLMLFGLDRLPDFAYGPGSCAAHLASAERRGLRSALLRHPGMGLDIDEPGDLRRLCDCLRGKPVTGHTAGLLIDTALGRRISAIELDGPGVRGERGSHDAV